MTKRRWLSPFPIMIPAIMAAALVLGYFSYRAAVKLAQHSEESVERSNRALGLKLIDRIEKVIIDNDRAFFNLVSLDDPQEFRELWRRIVRVSPAVESVIVLGEHHEVLHLVAKMSTPALKRFRRTLSTRVVPDMELEQLPIDQHKHLHREYDGVYFLMSFIRRQSAGSDYFIVLNIKLPYIIDEIFRQEFRELEDTNSIAVTDEDGRVLYGTPMAAGDPLLFEVRFPTTLYKWRLQIAPRQMRLLSGGARARRLSDLALVAGAVGIIWVGLLVLLLAIRKEQRATELRSEFISNVSHELKTPLSLIRMFGELLTLGQAKDPETTREYAEIISRESERLTRQIDNVLDFARMERGKAAYEMVDGDLRGVVEQVGDLCRYRTEQAGVKLNIQLPDEPVTVTHDESAMTLLLLNLVENALKYGTVPGSEIRVSLERVGTDSILSVADDGPGIGEDEVKRVFERFYRGRAARRGAQRGSGIGLSLVKNIAEAHGGRVEVRSAPGEGAVFVVRLPSKDSSASITGRMRRG